MRSLIGLGVLGVAVLGACGGTDGTPLLDGGGGDDSATDGGGGNDVQQKDGEGVDVATDATGDAACGGYCTSVKGVFCSDFDGESSPTDWSSVDATNGGAVTLTQSQDVSCPNGLATSLPMVSNPSQTGTHAKVVKNLVALTPLNHVVVTLEGLLPSADTKSYVIYFGVRPTAEPGNGIYLTHHGDAFWFLTSPSFGMNVAIPVAPLTDAWNAMSLDVVFGQSSGKVTFTYTGVDNKTHVVTGNGTTSNAPPSSVTLEVGMVAVGQTEAAFNAYYDNALLTSQ